MYMCMCMYVCMYVCTKARDHLVRSGSQQNAAAGASVRQNFTPIAVWKGVLLTDLHGMVWMV